MSVLTLTPGAGTLSYTGLSNGLRATLHPGVGSLAYTGLLGSVSIILPPIGVLKLSYAPNPPVPGNEIRISSQFTNEVDGQLIDPSVIAYSIKAPPLGTVSTPTPIRDSTGQYHLDVLMSTAGVWECRVTGTGNITVAAELRILVPPSDWV